MSFETPIAFTIFNRPKLTRRVFDAIARRKPKQLLVISDGPRETHPEDQRLVAESRRILERVDWPCEVKKNYSEQNLGCRDRMATGISWAFDQSEELIILEDDCLPDDSFFDFCRQLLERYRDDERVMMISGDNFQPVRRSNCSYYFSRWAHIWGWASWRRAWNYYDVGIKNWPSIREQQLLAACCDSPEECDHWQQLFDQQYKGEIDIWDYAWMYACWFNHGLTILPEKNLVTNLGFGENATHTLDGQSSLANLKSESIGELIHPDNVCRNLQADRWTFENIFRAAENSRQNLADQRRSWISWRRRTA